MVITSSEVAILSGSSHPALAEGIANHSGANLCKLKIETFPDGETSVIIEESVRGKNVYVVQSVALNPNHYLMELLIIIDALRRASAQSITAVIPYFGYARQDRKDRPRVPITAKLVADMLAKAGVAHVLTMDLHAPQVQGFFDVPVDDLQGKNVLLDSLAELKNHPLAVVDGSGLTYSTRSHFDAQRFMEVGKSNDPTVNTGWLGRHLATSTPVRADASLRALGFSDGLVDTLKGGPKTLPIPNPASYGLSGSSSTRSARQLWLENDYQATLEPARTAALDAIATINLLATLNLNAYQPANGAVYPNNGLGRGLRNTAGLIKADIGIEAAQLDVGG